MAKEKNLTAVTSVAAADFARVVTSAGASVKATFANVAKYIVETYNGSTVAGSAQSVKSALDSLNSKYGYISTGSYNDIQTYGMYLCQSLTNAPSSSFSQYCLIVLGSALTTKQIAFPTANDNNVYIRHYTNSTWSAWVAHVLP